MADNPSVQIDLQGNPDQFLAALKKIEDESKKTGDKVSDSFSFSKLVSAQVIGQAVVGGIKAATNVMTDFFQNSIKESAQAADELNRFNNALRLSGTYSKENSEAFQAFASSMQQVTTFTDDAILSAGSLLATYTKLSGQGLQNATKAALDFSAATGKDLSTSVMLLSKAINGQGENLRMYGITIGETESKSARLSSIISQINNNMGGSAASMVSTYTGAMARASNMYGEILESTGKLVTSSPTVISSINTMADGFKKIADRIADGDFKNLSSYIDGIARAMANIPSAAEKGASALDSFVGGANNVKSFITDAFGKVVGGIGAGIGGLMGGGAQGAAIGTIIQAAFSPDAKVIMDGQQRASDVLNMIMSTAIANANANAQANPAVVPVTVDATMMLVMSETIKQKTKEMADTATADAQRIGAAFYSAMAGGVVKATKVMTQAFIKGQGSIKGFGKAFIGIIGNIATQTGQTLIMTGIGIDALKGLQGGLAIAAGIALVALGELANSWAGGEGGGVPDTGGGAAGMGGGLGGGMFGEQGKAARPDTNVQVVIQGSIMDSQETGSRIVSLINQSFEQTGQTIARGAAL
jgi:hypothetical protein